MSDESLFASRIISIYISTALSAQEYYELLKVMPPKTCVYLTTVRNLVSKFVLDEFNPKAYEMMYTMLAKWANDTEQSEWLDLLLQVSLESMKPLLRDRKNKIHKFMKKEGKVMYYKLLDKYCKV
jgi:hypothetical protein